MKATVEKQEKNLAEIQLEIEAEHAIQEYNKACRRLGQRVNIPGFRRGKAPRNIIEKTVGIERIKQEAIDRLLPHAFADVISEHQLDVVSTPQIESFKFDLKDGIQIKAQVELRPDVILGELKQTVKVALAKVSEDAEARELEAIVARMTTLEAVIDRPVQADDIVVIDFSGSIGDELIKGGAAKNFRLDLLNSTFIPGFAEKLVGHTLGEEFTINVTFPENYHDKTLAAKEAQFSIKINQINRRVVPELSDELAQRIGPYETLDALKQAVQDHLNRMNDEENDFRKQKAVIDAVVAQAQVEVPDSMVNREAKLLMEEVQRRFKTQGLSWEEFIDSQGHENIWENLRKEAVQRIKTTLTFGGIAKDKGLQVSDDEFAEQVAELAQTRNMDQKSLMRQLAHNPGAIQSLTDQILGQKVVEFLMEQVSFEYTDEEPPVGATASASDAAVQAASAGSAPAAVTAPGLEGEEFEVLEAED